MMKSRFDILKEAGCRVCCSDIDAAGLSNLRDNKAPVEYKNVEAISKMKQLLDMPLIIKGIMTKEDALKALEAGADDFIPEDDAFEVYTSVASFSEVRSYLESKGLNFFESQIEMLPQNEITLEGDDLAKFKRLIDALEDLDDVQNVYHNVNLPEDEEE